MIVSKEQERRKEGLLGTIAAMRALRDEIIAEWEKNVRLGIKASRTVSQPILIDTLPAFFDDLVDAVAALFHPLAEKTTTLPAEHGSERARLTNYDPQDVVQECQILRATIIDVLDRHDVKLSHDEWLAMNTYIDQAIRDSVSAYTLVHSALRERFVAALTHDLRTPLSAAHMAAQIALKITDSAQVGKLLERILQNHRQMDRMIHDLLDTVVFHHGEKVRLQLAHVDILDVVKDVRDQFDSIHGKRVQISGEPVRGCWNRDALRRALENLVSNAFKYGAPEAPVRISVASGNGRVLLRVHNEGDPIPPEHLETVFQVFRRADAARKGQVSGWGIGLPYVRAVAESHGGSVAITSSREDGTTFLIDIPIDAQPFQDTQTFAEAGMPPQEDPDADGAPNPDAGS